jgi:lysyl-tRNA synthetase, class II
LGDDEWTRLAEADVGDILTAEGIVYVTDNHKLTLSVVSSMMLTKALRPPPVWARGAKAAPAPPQRPRELDLLTSERARKRLEVRARAIHALRDWMARHHFTEIEGPVLQGHGEGDPLRAFVSRSCPREPGVRTSNQMYLRRCVLGGFERVYELARCFGSQQASSYFSPTGTMLEWCTAFADRETVARQAQDIITHAAQTAAIAPRLTLPGSAVELALPWQTTTAREAIMARCDIDVLTSDAHTLAMHPALGGAASDDWGELAHALYEKVVESALIQPTIVYDLPLLPRTLAKRHPAHPKLSRSFAIVIGGVELVGGDSEVNDPDERRERCAAAAKRGSGTVTGFDLDEEIRMLEYGMSPSAGASLRVDRLVMLLTGCDSVHEVIPFPTPA